MSNKNKNEELQSRREFFKKAAKAALPVVGAVVLSSVPFVKAKAATSCGFSDCSNSCLGRCENTCHYGCRGNCEYSCQGSCRSECQGSCKYGCGSSANF